MREVGRYRIQREIGRGATAVVYLARQLDIHRPVALKELAGLFALDATATARFLKEAQLAGSLNDPNIVIVHDYFEHGGVPYIAMEFLERGSLRPLVGSLTTDQICVALHGILSGLGHAHEHGIVHRDLKPENVMQTEAGGVKIADFGIATVHNQLATVNLTPLDEFLGSPGYVAPEQVHGDQATPASDLYAVGAMAFEFFTGEVPFAGPGDAMALLQRKVSLPPPRLRPRRPDLDLGLTGWVDSLLASDLAKRPSNAREARAELEEIVDRLLGPKWKDTVLVREPQSAVPTPSPEVSSRFASPRILRAYASRGTLAANAATRPVTVAVAVAVAAAAVFITAWLIALAAVVYLALAAITFFDEAEAARVGRGAIRSPRRGVPS